MAEAIVVTFKGPIFDGRAVQAGHDLTNALADRTQAYALERVQANLNAAIRNPTPYYETQVTTDRRGGDRVVWDRGVVYGAWLEGTGSRNKTTRFKGYHSFRRAADTTRQAVPKIAGGLNSQYLRRMNGS